ncbi:MAG: hypothetical protein QOE35_1624 [Actinomycetota bacterium]|jgi:hypothetical protein
MKRALVLLAVTAGALLLPMRPAAADPAGDEADFIQRTNALRAEKGAPPLSVDAELTDIARRWSAHMADQGELSHNPNLGDEAHDWQMLGENVGTGPTVESIHNAFVNSEHHYANLVDPSFTLIGVGVVERDGRIWVTEDFKQPAKAAASRPAPAPAPPRPAAPPRPRPRPAPAAPRPATAPQAQPVSRPPTAPVAMQTPPAPPVPVTASPTPVTPSPVTTQPPSVAGRQYERVRSAAVDHGPAFAQGVALALLGLVASRAARMARVAKVRRCAV